MARGIFVWVNNCMGELLSGVVQRWGNFCPLLQTFVRIPCFERLKINAFIPIVIVCTSGHTWISGPGKIHPSCPQPTAHHRGQRHTSESSVPGWSVIESQMCSCSKCYQWKVTSLFFKLLSDKFFLMLIIVINKNKYFLTTKIK